MSCGTLVVARMSFSIATAYSPRRAARLHLARGTEPAVPPARGPLPDGLLPVPKLQSRLLDGAGKRNANAQGSRDLNRTFMAFKRAEASSPDWPPDKNAIPGTAAGYGSQEIPHRGFGHRVHRFLLGAGQTRKHHVGLTCDSFSGSFSNGLS